MARDFPTSACYPTAAQPENTARIAVAHRRGAPESAAGALVRGFGGAAGVGLRRGGLDRIHTRRRRRRKESDGQSRVDLDLLHRSRDTPGAISLADTLEGVGVEGG